MIATDIANIFSKLKTNIVNIAFIHNLTLKMKLSI